MDGPVRGRGLRLSGAAQAGLLAAPLALLALFYAWPLAQTLRAADASGWPWIASAYVRGRLGVALLQALLSVALTLALAIPLAWHHHARAIPFGRLQMAMHAAPFVMPVFVVVYGLQMTAAPLLATPLLAVVVAHAYYNYGFAARLLRAALDRRPRRLEEAARTLGAPARGAFWRVAFPLLLPSLAAVALLVFLFAFTSFGVVLLLGAGEVGTPETLLYQSLGGAYPRLERAAALGALQLALGVALLAGYHALLRRAAGLERDARPRRLPARRRDAALQWMALALAMAPLAAVLAGGFRVGGAWSLEAWRALLDAEHPSHLAGFDLGRAVALSLLYAASAVVISVLLTMLLAYAREDLPAPLRRAADALSSLPLATSSLLLGLGYLLAFGAGAWLDLRGSAAVVVLAHTLVAFPFTARILLPALAARDRRLDESAALLGASRAGLVARVHLPMLAAPLAAAAGLAAAMSLGDFGASLLLMRPDNMALGIWIAQHDAPFDPILKAQAIALAALLGVLTAAAYGVLERAGETP